MIRIAAPILVAVVCAPTLAFAACEDLKARIAEDLTAKGVSGYQLEILASDAVDARAEVGRCEAGSKKIVYSRGDPVPAVSTAPRATEQVVRAAEAAVPARLAPASTPVPPVVMNPARSAPASKPFRDPLQEGGEGPLMVMIPPGEFVMGSVMVGMYREGPEHRVTMKAFALAQTEVTFDDYDRFAKASGRRLPEDGGLGRGTRPVISVSWFDASEYAQWLSAQTGFSYRLPSEAEWEYAARAGGKRGMHYTAGDCISARDANFTDVPSMKFSNCPASNSSVGMTQPVASYAPNALGLYDMHGNVSEWTADCVHLGYEQAPSDGRAWLEWADGNCNDRIVRGGSWQSGQMSLRMAARAALSIRDVSAVTGFRVARAIPPPQR